MLITVVALGALLLAYVALVASWLALRTLARVRRAGGPARPAGSGDRAADASLVARLDELEARVEATGRRVAAGRRTGAREAAEALEALREDVGRSLRRFALVRFDAFGAQGGRRSFSLALLDDAGDGVALTSIAGATGAQVYAKGVSAGAGEQELSPEEAQAVAAALRGDGAADRAAS